MRLKERSQDTEGTQSAVRHRVGREPSGLTRFVHLLHERHHLGGRDRHSLDTLDPWDDSSKEFLNSAERCRVVQFEAANDRGYILAVGQENFAGIVLFAVALSLMGGLDALLGLFLPDGPFKARPSETAS